MHLHDPQSGPRRRWWTRTGHGRWTPPTQRPGTARAPRSRCWASGEEPLDMPWLTCAHRRRAGLLTRCEGAVACCAGRTRRAPTTRGACSRPTTRSLRRPFGEPSKRGERSTRPSSSSCSGDLCASCVLQAVLSGKRGSHAQTMKRPAERVESARQNKEKRERSWCRDGSHPPALAVLRPNVNQSRAALQLCTLPLAHTCASEGAHPAVTSGTLANITPARPPRPPPAP